MRDIILIGHDIRSTHNVGSLLRTAECLGVKKVYLTGYTPYPKLEGDRRLPYIAEKITKQIHKTALGAENSIEWSQSDEISPVLRQLKKAGYQLIGLEQNPKSTPLPDFSPPTKCALLLGREVEGIDQKLLVYCDEIVEIPQFGKKESLNVVQAAAIALYHFVFTS